MVYGVECILESNIGNEDIFVCVFCIFKGCNDHLDLSSCVSHSAETFLTMVYDFLVFSKGGEEGS